MNDFLVDLSGVLAALDLNSGVSGGSGANAEAITTFISKYEITQLYDVIVKEPDFIQNLDVTKLYLIRDLTKDAPTGL